MCVPGGEKGIMPKAQRALPVLSRQRYLTGLLGACALWMALGSHDLVLARAAYGDFNTNAEGWAWSQIKQGEIADFNKHCVTPVLDPRNEKDKRWHDDCRKL